MMRAVAPARVLLAVNGGSSTVKCALFSYGADPTPIDRGVLDDTGAGSISALLAWIDAHADRSAIAAIGHRVTMMFCFLVAIGS